MEAFCMHPATFPRLPPLLGWHPRACSRPPCPSPPSAKLPPAALSFTALASRFCNFVEDLVLPPPPPSSRPSSNVFLSSNFAPLPHESPPTPCLHVEGTIPPALNGVFLRNGPNPLHPPSDDYHFFDGDGMVHAVTINNGQAVHACRYVRTNRFVREVASTRPLFVRPITDLHGLKGIAKLLLLLMRHLLGIIDISKGFGSANAGLVYFNGKVLAMSEDDMPYALHLSDDGDIHNIGRFDFGGKLKSNMTAHPKVDPLTKDLFSFSTSLLLPPYLKYFRASKDGEKFTDMIVKTKEPLILHDFAVTKNYAIFYEHQITFKLCNLLQGGSPFVIDTMKQPKIIIVPRYDTDGSNMQRLECPHNFGCCMHILNAWEEGDEVILIGCTNEPLELVFKDIEKVRCKLMKFTFNLKTNQSGSELVTNANIDMGRINQNYLGRKTRFAYLCTYGPWPKYSGICKIDLEAPYVGYSQGDIDNNEPSLVGLRMFGPQCYGSEPCFVPRTSNPCNEEDDGYLVTFVHDELRNLDKLLIMSAKSSSLETIASITLPIRVPYGFHSLFVSALELENRKISSQ